MEQHQITIRPRHLRKMFFVEADIAFDKLFKLMLANQKVWGGRYNPIVPVYDNVINEKYIDAIRNYDPDQIYYSPKVNPEVIKELRLFNPKKYYELEREVNYDDVTGVNTAYIINKVTTNGKILTSSGLEDIKGLLENYFAMNYGLTIGTSAVDLSLLKDVKQIRVTNENFSEIHKLIHTERPYNINAFSRTGASTTILRNIKEINYRDFELVIARNNKSNEDLFYYWNRMLYGGKGVLYLTLEELDVLITDKYFPGTLYDFSSDNELFVVSKSLSTEELKNVIEKKLKASTYALNTRFTQRNIDQFPFEILNHDSTNTDLFTQSSLTQIVIGQMGIVDIPAVNFLSKIEYSPQQWALEVAIRRVGVNAQREMKVPFTTNTQFIIRAFNGRVNKNRNIVLFMDTQENRESSFEITIPEARSLVQQVISQPVINGTIYPTPYKHIGLHDASNRLQAFLKLFDFDFHEIEEFFSDVFWVDMFEFLITNNKNAGDSITFKEIKERCIAALTKKGVTLVERSVGNENEENLELGLKRTLGRLCERKIFLQGIKIKCPHCSSVFWYPIAEINSQIVCKGCLEASNMPVEPKFSYKLNDLIKNNIFQNKTDRDGNLTVIRTLVFLNERSMNSFYYYPQINLYPDYHIKKPINEIDIVCISDGELIFGESKHDSSMFFENKMKSLNALVDLAKVTLPDQIILSCYKDSGGKLANAVKSLSGLFKGFKSMPRIISLQVTPPHDFNLGHHNYFYY